MHIKKRTFAILVSMAPMLALVGLILTVDGCVRAWEQKHSTMRLVRSNQTGMASMAARTNLP